MNQFIETPFDSNIFVAIVFGLLIGAGYVLSKVQSAFDKRLTPGKSTFATFGVAVFAMILVFGSAVSGLWVANEKNLEWTQVQIQEKYGLSLSSEHEGKPVFEFLDDFEKKVWNVSILDGEGSVHSMELRFDSKSGEPIISSPDLFGVPSP